MDHPPDIADPPPPPATSRWGVLRHAHFRIFWFASFGSFLGSWFEFVGTQWIVGEATGSTLWASYLAAAQLLPTLFLGLLGGIVADRVNRKKLLFVTQLAMMLIAIAFAVVVFLGWAEPWVLVVLSLGQGIAIAFNNPAWQVMTPRLVPREDLQAAITLTGIAFNIARALGPAIAGIVMWLAGPQWLFALNALSFIGILFAVLKTPDAPAPSHYSTLFSPRILWDDTREALRYVFAHRGLRSALIACVIFAMLATPVLRFLALFVTEVYHEDEKVFGVLTGVMGVGAVAGGFLMKAVPAWYPKHHLIPVSATLGGIWILLFSITDNVWAAGFHMFFVGLFWMWTFNACMSALQLLVTDNLRGRVMAVCNVAALGLMPLGNFIASGAGESLSALVRHRWPSYWDPGTSTQIGVAFVSIVLIFAGIAMVIWRTPEIDGLCPGDPGYDRRPGFWRGVLASTHRPRE